MCRSATFSVFVVLGLLAPASSHAQPVRFLDYPAGYVAGALPLGAGNSAFALAADPDDDNHVYVSGTFEGASRIVRLNIASGERTAVFTCPTTVTVSGFAVMSADVMFLSDNWNDHLYVLQDNNPQDGDFDDPNEIRELIAPILTHPTFGWTGSAVCVVRSDANRLGLPAGTVLFQSEDGGTDGEVLAVLNPLTSPTYQPVAGAYFSGFSFGGGLAITSAGRLVVASSTYPDTGAVWICEDTSNDGVIGEGESNLVLERASATTASAGLSTLAIDRSDRCLTCVGRGFGSSAFTEIQSFDIPLDPLGTTVSARTFATLNSPYVSGLVLNTTSRDFAPFTDNGAILILAANDPFFAGLDYLLTLSASGSLGVRRWNLY